MVKTERMCNMRQVRSPENIHTPYASRFQKEIRNTDRLVSKCKTVGRGTLKDRNFYQTYNEKLCKHSSINELMKKVHLRNTD